MNEKINKGNQPGGTMSRREMLRIMGLTGAAAFLSPFAVRQSLGQSVGGGLFPNSPRILEPFKDALPIPLPLAPSDPRTWTNPAGAALPPDPLCNSTVLTGQPGGLGVPHQIWQTPADYYRIQLRTAQHNFSSSSVPDPANPGQTRKLPASTISGFNGTFPGPLIRAWYGRPCLVRYENLLSPNDGTDFGVPAFLAHLQNAHTACESDGNPHFNPVGYDSWYLNGAGPAERNWFCDNLYLNSPAGGDDREKLSSLWLSDRRLGHAGANTYKGLVGFYQIYDPGFDCLDELIGCRLPAGGCDVPLAFADVRLDDGVTQHAGTENKLGEEGPLDSGPKLQDGLAHPANWGKLFFAKYPTHGFVGDIYTVNGTAWPAMEVNPRNYRFRFLNSSISRWYRFGLMKGSVVDGTDVGEQWKLGNSQQCMRFTQVAADGGLLPQPIIRDAFTLAPGKRKEMVIDFAHYQDGSRTQVGDVVYLTTVLKWTDGRKPDDSVTSGFVVPILKFIITGGLFERDGSVILPVLREQPPIPSLASLDTLPHRTFDLQDSAGGGTINGSSFDPLVPGQLPTRGTAEIWTIRNGSAGTVFGMQPHLEEHRILGRIGNPVWYDDHPDDGAKEDVIALAPGEQLDIYRNFRTFNGPYVAQCNNLAQGDNGMMFGWTNLI